MSYAIVGRGRLGSGFARALRAAGAGVEEIPGRAAATVPSTASVVLLAVPDPAIAEVAAQVPESPGRVLLHCSGSLGPEALAPWPERGAMHPLVSFADPEQPPSLVGTRWFVAGAPRAVAAAHTLAETLGAVSVEAAVHGPVYHAAAALSANGAAALATVAVGVLTRLGVSRPDASVAIGALLSSVGENVARVGVPRALSGPVMRGDADAVRRHRAALAVADPDALAAYDAVASPILDCARAAGLSEERAAEVRAAIEGAAIEG